MSTLFLSLLSTIVFQPIISDRSIYEKPLIDAVVIEKTGQIVTPCILKGKDIGTGRRLSLLLIDSRAWRPLLMLLQQGKVTIVETPLRIRRGDQWAVFGGAVLAVEHSKKLFSVKGKLGKGEIYWSDWIKKHPKLPHFPMYATWQIDVPGSELDYNKKVANTLRNINKSVIQDMLNIHKMQMDAEYFAAMADSAYVDLGCKEARRTANYTNQKHADDCKTALDEVLMWQSRVYMYNKAFNKKKSLLASNKAGIAEVEKKGLKDK